MATDTCPKCKANLRGEPIPEDKRHYYGNETHFMRTIGVYCMERDMTVAWRCPDCGHEWPREGGEVMESIATEEVGP